MGAIVKGVASLFGGRKRRREQKRAGKALKGHLAQQDAFQRGNNWQDMKGVNYDVTQGHLKKSSVSAEDLVREAKKKIDEISKQDGLSGVSSGFDKLDKIT